MNSLIVTRIFKRCVAVAVLLLAHLLSPHSQPNTFNQDWRWIHFTTESGLPSNYIYNLTETSDATVWVATAKGIAWFDNYRWHRVDTSLSPPYGRCAAFYPTEDNRIVAVVGDEAYIGGKQGFKPLANMLIQNAVPFGKDSILFLSEGYLYLHTSRRVVPFDHANTSSIGKVFDMWYTSGRGVWVSSASSLYRWENGKWFSRFESGSKSLRLSRHILVENIQGNGFGEIDVPLNKWGVWEWTKNSTMRLAKGGARVSLQAATINSKDHVLAIYWSGLKRIRVNGEWQDVHFVQPSIRDIEFVQYRQNDDVWFGTQQGLFLYRHSSERWTYLDKNTAQARGSINEFLYTSKGELWVASSAGVEIHKPNGSVKFIDEINGVILYMVTGLAEASNGNVWVTSGGSFDGAFEWDGKRWQLHAEGTPLYGKRIHKIRKDNKGRLWFLAIWPAESFGDSTAELGADVYADGKFVEHWGLDDGLPSQQVYSFAEGNDGAYWFGTLLGLSRWKNGVWRHWSSDTSVIRFRSGKKVPHTRIFTIAIDIDGRVWFGDRNNGLGCIATNDSLRTFTANDGLVNNEVWDLRTDSEDRLWIATSGGLSCYRNGTWSSFSAREGLLSSELWPVLPVDGKVYISSRGVGVSILNLSEIQMTAPAIVIDDPTMQDVNARISWKSYGYWGEPANDDILSRYRVDGGSWSNWATISTRMITGLEPGKHTIQVQSLGLLGKLDEAGATREFWIEEKFYRHPFFVGSIVGLSLIAFSLGAVSFVRKRKHDAQLRESEAQFRAITETTASAILIYDAKKILFANHGAENLTGYSIKELIQMSVTDVLQPDSLELFKRKTLALQPSNVRNQRMELKIKRRNKEERWVDYTEGVIRFLGMRATVGTGFDVTERKDAEERNLANQAELRSLATELSTTEERERRRMATFLHDTIGQALAVCKLKLSGLQRSTVAAPLQEGLDEIKFYLDQSIQNTRSLTFELSPPILHELGLVAAIEWLAEDLETQHAIKFTCQDDGQEKPLTDELRPLLFHAVRELLMNVIKHSEAKNVTIAMERNNSSLWITVLDDGVGFDLSRVSHTTKDGGFGLFNIRERLAYLGGGMEIISSSNAGTKVILTAPIESTRQRRDKKIYA